MKTQHDLMPATGAGAGRPTPCLAGTLGTLDRRVIALAAGEPLASIRPPSRVERAMRRFFGLGRRTVLADPGLEALRVYAIRCWRGQPGASSRHAADIVAHGYDPVDVLRAMGWPTPVACGS